MNHTNSKNGGRPPPAGNRGNELKLQQEEIVAQQWLQTPAGGNCQPNNGAKLQQEEIVSPTMALNSGRKK